MGYIPTVVHPALDDRSRQHPHQPHPPKPYQINERNRAPIEDTSQTTEDKHSALSAHMSSNFSFELGGAPYTIPSPTEKPIAYVATIVLFVILAYALGDHGAKLPEINPLKPFEFSNSRRILEFFQTSKELMLKGRAKFGDSPYKLMTEWGSVLVLPPDFIHELRSDPNLAFEEPAKDVRQKIPSSSLFCLSISFSGDEWGY